MDETEFLAGQINEDVSDLIDKLPAVLVPESKLLAVDDEHVLDLILESSDYESQIEELKQKFSLFLDFVNKKY